MTHATIAERLQAAEDAQDAGRPNQAAGLLLQLRLDVDRVAVARVDKVARLERLLDDLDGNDVQPRLLVGQVRALLRELGAL